MEEKNTQRRTLTRKSQKDVLRAVFDQLQKLLKEFKLAITTQIILRHLSIRSAKDSRERPRMFKRGQ